jgi:hypothetical protein
MRNFCGFINRRGATRKACAACLSRWVRAAAWSFFVATTDLGVASAWGAAGQLEITVTDKDTGKPVACRMHLAGPNGNKPRRADKVPFWHDHFVLPGKILLKLPLGDYSFVLERGLEYLNVDGRFTINPMADDAKQIELRRFVNMPAEGWWSGDLDVRRSPADIKLLMLAEDLHVAEVISKKASEKGTGPFLNRGPVPVSGPVQFDNDRYYDLMAAAVARPGGEALLFHLPEALKLRESDKEYPSLAQAVKEAKGKADVWVDVSRPFWWDLPLLVALGAVDSIQVAHSDICRDTVISHDIGGKPRDKVHYPDPYGNPQWSQDIYFRLLECGLRIPPSAGSGSGDAPNPVGQNRMYVHVQGDFTYEKWWQSFREGKVVITNGPLMRPTVNGQLPGHVFRAPAGTKLDFEIGMTISIRDPVSYVEIIKDGQVAHAVRFEEYAKSGTLPPLSFEQSGWFLVRAVTDVGKTYRFAMTAPYYVEIGERPRISKKAAQFFLDWVYERAKQIKIDNPDERKEVMDLHRQARDFWRGVLDKANAE